MLASKFQFCGREIHFLSNRSHLAKNVLPIWCGNGVVKREIVVRVRYHQSLIGIGAGLALTYLMSETKGAEEVLAVHFR